jgi:predicted nucleic acid-binding protein
VVDASLSLQWYLKDEQERYYALAVLSGLRDNEAIVPFLWTYEIGNALVVAHRRKRLDEAGIEQILESLRALPIIIDQPEPESALKLPSLPLKHDLTVYDAAYLEMALRFDLPMATNDKSLKRAMANSGLNLVKP